MNIRKKQRSLATDRSMPMMDGWETARQIQKRQQATPASVIIMVTARSRASLAQRMQSEPGTLDGFLVKGTCCHEVGARHCHDGRCDGFRQGGMPRRRHE